MKQQMLEEELEVALRQQKELKEVLNEVEEYSNKINNLLWKAKWINRAQERREANTDKGEK